MEKKEIMLKVDTPVTLTPASQGPLLPWAPLGISPAATLGSPAAKLHQGLIKMKITKPTSYIEISRNGAKESAF